MTLPMTPLTFTTPDFAFSYDPAAGEFHLRTARGTLRLACQGSVSAPGKLDAGTDWTFLGASERDGRVYWRLAAQQTRWQSKHLEVEITPREVLFRLTVTGDGPIDRVTWFAGVPAAQQPEPGATFGHLQWARPAWSRAWTGSPLSFASVLNPQPVMPGPQALASGVPQRLTCATTFGPELFNTFFAPPLYAYIFDDAYCLGVAAPMAASNFHHFDYVPTAGWGLELHYDGRTAVAGTWQSPALRVAPCPAADQGWQDYVAYLHNSGLAPAPARDLPDWAYRPMFCGWGQQTVWANQASRGTPPTVGSPITPGAGGYASQAAYEEMVRLLDERGVPYGTLTIDMGWSQCLTIPRPNEQLWPDLKGFIARLHARGKRVFLWLATWNPGGLDPALRLPDEGGLAASCDPSNPAFRAQLAAAVAQAVSPAHYHADGFKVDFTGDGPRGGTRTAGGKWGLALLHDYLQLIHQAMKDANPDTVLETHCANPQFADVTEMLRLNDIFSTHLDVRPAMAFRARLARLALPGYPIDTDNDPFIARAAWLDYLRLQPQLGVPSLYTLTHMSFCRPGEVAEPLLATDWDELRALWLAYEVQRPGSRQTS